MKKLSLFLILLIGVLFSFTFTSCSSDDDETLTPANATTIVGTWVTSWSGKVTNADITYVTNKTLTFKSDGSYLIEENTVFTSGQTDTEYEKGTFTVDANNLFTFDPTYSDYMTTLEKYSVNMYLSGNRLKVGDQYYDKK